ncbi:hypothetical protein SUGI_0132690 [Cryptomeria japonica]|nr:hypothetical protein SUGI_0132690 [Cryptomeria japonica]
MMQTSLDAGRTFGLSVATHFVGPLVDSDGDGVVHVSSSRLWHGDGARKGCMGFFPEKMNHLCPKISCPHLGPSELILSSLGVTLGGKIASSYPPIAAYGSYVVAAMVNVHGTSPAGEALVFVVQGPSFKEIIIGKSGCRSSTCDA